MISRWLLPLVFVQAACATAGQTPPRRGRVLASCEDALARPAGPMAEADPAMEPKDLGDAAFEACVAGVFRSLRFPRPAGHGYVRG